MRFLGGGLCGGGGGIAVDHVAHVTDDSGVRFVFQSRAVGDLFFDAHGERCFLGGQRGGVEDRLVFEILGHACDGAHVFLLIRGAVRCACGRGFHARGVFGRQHLRGQHRFILAFFLLG